MEGTDEFFSHSELNGKPRWFHWLIWEPVYTFFGEKLRRASIRLWQGPKWIQVVVICLTPFLVAILYTIIVIVMIFYFWPISMCLDTVQRLYQWLG